MQNARLAELQGTAAGHLLSLSAAPQMWAAVLNGRHFPLRCQERGSASTPLWCHQMCVQATAPGMCSERVWHLAQFILLVFLIHVIVQIRYLETKYWQYEEPASSLGQQDANLSLLQELR